MIAVTDWLRRHMFGERPAVTPDRDAALRLKEEARRLQETLATYLAASDPLAAMMRDIASRRKADEKDTRQ